VFREMEWDVMEFELMQMTLILHISFISVLTDLGYGYNVKIQAELLDHDVTQGELKALFFLFDPISFGFQFVMRVNMLVRVSPAVN